jgi:hypothetical protein
MTHHTKRPDFPMDAMTADERRALEATVAEQLRRRGDGTSYRNWGPQLIAEFERAELNGLAAGLTHSPKPARTSVAHQRYNDGAPVKATLGNFLAMSLGAATIIVVLGGLYLEFAALAH